MDLSEIQFLRPKDYKFIKEINRGGFGKAVLLRDEIIDEQFVCKKYDPLYEQDKEQFFKNFIHEIKLLHLLNDKNIVRVFNYYLYPEFNTGYILMEYINGSDIEAFISCRPDKINDIFKQTIDGFSHLEQLQILHRDIRPLNILVNNDDVVKIIDFGFGKQIEFIDESFDNSVSLNWRYAPPSEFKNRVYNFTTEVYFVGKLFEELLQQNNIQNFKYISSLRNMIQTDCDKRTRSFFDVNRSIIQNQSNDISFDIFEKGKYQRFASALNTIIASIYNDCTYFSDIDTIASRLDDVYEKSMLEDILQNNVLLIKCFLNGGYRYQTKKSFSVAVIKDFADFFRSVPIEKKKIVLNNIWQRLDTISRTQEEIIDDLPF